MKRVKKCYLLVGYLKYRYKMACWAGCLANNHNGQMVFHYLLYRNTRFVTVCFVLMLIHL